MDLLCRSPRLLYLATSVCIWNRRKKKKNAQKEKNSFFAYSKLWKESLKQIHQNSKWAFFAGLLGCCTWQQVSASGTEGIRREMCQKKKNPSLQLVNCGKKVWKQFTKNTKSVLFPPCVHFFSICCVAKMKGSNFELICLKNRAWAHVGGGGAQFFSVQKYRKKMDKKCKWTHFSAFFDCAALQGIAASVPREKRRKVRQMKKKWFLGPSAKVQKGWKQFTQKSKWTYFAGLFGCCTWQQASASGTEEKRREMRKKTKIPSLHLVNCPKKVWKKFTQNTKSICPSLFPLIYTRPWTKKQHSKFELICWENRAWAHGGGGGARLG